MYKNYTGYFIAILNGFIFLPLYFSIIFSIRYYIVINYVLSKDDIKNIISLLHLLSLYYLLIYTDKYIKYTIEKNISKSIVHDELNADLYIYNVESFHDMMLLFAIIPNECIYMYNTDLLPRSFKTIMRTINESMYKYKEEIQITYIYATCVKNNSTISMQRYSKKYNIHNIRFLD